MAEACKGCRALTRDRGFERSEFCSLQCERAYEAGRRAGAEEMRERSAAQVDDFGRGFDYQPGLISNLRLLAKRIRALTPEPGDVG